MTIQFGSCRFYQAVLNEARGTVTSTTIAAAFRGNVGAGTSIETCSAADHQFSLTR